MARRKTVANKEEDIFLGIRYHVIDRDEHRKELERWKFDTEEEAIEKYYSLQVPGHIRELEMIKEARFYTLKEERIN